jgi:hypothetical protein
VLIGLAPLCAAQGTGELACRADYTIRARVEPTERSLSGEETITWSNATHDDVFDLEFHSYWNAFANNRSTHMRESAGSARGSAMLADDWGWQRITSIEIDGRELVSKLRYIQPDDEEADDRTVFSVPLPAINRPGESVKVNVKWEARIPRVRERTGCKDDFLFIAQWFPKLGVYDAGNGWNCHQFHASTEFFSDYGTYDVTLDLPARYEGKIGASGVEAEPERSNGERVIARFVAPSAADQKRDELFGKHPLVHDFAWTADPRYVVHDEFTFHFDEWAARYKSEVERVALALGRGIDELRSRDVAVTLLMHPEHDDQAQRHFEAACASLFFYGLWFGGYPYEHITVVDPAWGAGGAGGMEYPTLFTDAPTRERHRARVRPSILVRPRRQQRVRSRVARRRLQHVQSKRDAAARVRSESRRERILGPLLGRSSARARAGRPRRRGRARLARMAAVENDRAASRALERVHRLVEIATGALVRAHARRCAMERSQRLPRGS